MYDVVFNNTTLRLCRRATALGPTHLPAEFLGPGGLTHPEQVSLHLVLAYTLSPEFPDQIPGDFRGMNRLLPGLDSQRGTLPLVGARGTVGGGGTKGVDRLDMQVDTMPFTSLKVSQVKNRGKNRGKQVLAQGKILTTSYELWES